MVFLQPEAPYEMIELAQGATHYQLEGKSDNKTVVLVHGNAAPLITWDNTMGALLDAGFRVLRYDLFGHGYSSRPHLRRYNASLYDDQLSDLLSRLDISWTVSLIGSSQGGSICARFAATHPQAVGELALIAPFFDGFSGSAKTSLLRIPIIGEIVLRLVPDRAVLDLSGAVVDPGIRATLSQKLAQQMRHADKRRAILANLRGDALRDATSVYATLAELNLESLLIWGDQDKRISAQSMARLRTIMPDIQYHQIAGAAHLAHYEFSELVNPILRDFLVRE